MWEKVFGTLRDRFRNGRKSVFRKKTQFLPFFVALFLILSLFFTLTLAFDSHDVTVAETIRAEYDYHLVIKGLNQSQALTLESDPRTVFSNDYVYDVVAVSEHMTEGADSRYDVYIFFRTGNKIYGIFGLFKPDTIQADYASFSARYRDVYAPEEGNAGTLHFSPLYRLDDLHWQNLLTAVLSLAGAFLFSCWVLGELFRIRLSQDCFAYGIYATFGADARRLRSAAFWEMAFCVLVDAIPAAVFSAVAGYLLYGAQGIPFHVRPLVLLLPLLLCVPLLFCAVRLPMKLLAQREPLSLIAAADNSTLVSHPRASGRLIGRAFPRFYEWLTGFRYRRHYLRVMLVSALLSSLFICGVYLGDLCRVTATVHAETDTAFSVFFSDTVPDDAYATFSALSGVQSVRPATTRYSLESNAMFVSVPKSQCRPFSGLSAHPLDDTQVVFNDAALIGVDNQAALDYFSATYRITGDLTAVLRDSDTVAVGRTIGNREVFSYEVGDRIRIAVPTATISPIPDASMLSGNGLLQEEILHLAYEYHTFVIGAIIEQYPSMTNGLPILLNDAAYETVTGTPWQTRTLSVSIDPHLSAPYYRALENDVRDTAFAYPGARVTASNTYFTRRMENALAVPSLVLLAAAVSLIFIPLLWFFSQLFFAGKRAQEFHVLRAMGAPMGRVRRLHAQNALFVLPLVIPSLLLSFLCMTGVWWLSNNLIPYLFLLDPVVVLPLEFSGFPYILTFLLTFVCSSLSAFFPYLRYRRAQYRDPFEYFGKEGEL